MTSRIFRLALVMLAAVALSACSSAVDVDETSSAAGGTIELAVSGTCAGASVPECVSVNGENILLPSEFELAGFMNAAAVEGAGQDVVDVTFDLYGAAILHALSEEAAEAGRLARLLTKAGGEVLAAFTVIKELKSDQVQIAISLDENAQGFLVLIRGG